MVVLCSNGVAVVMEGKKMVMAVTLERVCEC